MSSGRGVVVVAMDDNVVVVRIVFYDNYWYDDVGDKKCLYS